MPVKLRTVFGVALALLIACGEAEHTSAAQAERQLDGLSMAGAGVARASTAPTPEERGRVTKVAVHGEPQGRSVRTVLHVEGEPPMRRTERTSFETGARRMVLVFEATGAPASALGEVQVGRAGLDAVSVARRGADLVVELSLAKDARYALFSLPDPTRIVIDVEHPRPIRSVGSKLLLLDPGHGGEDRGSPGPFGLWEGQLTLDLSRRTKAWLERIAPEIRVRLTRDSDVYITLEERAAMANSLGADLFVSVHLNAAPTTVDRGGVAAFVLDTDNDRNVLRLAARENGTSTTNVSPMQFLVGSLARNEQRDASLRAARFIQRGTLVSGRRLLPTLADRGVKSAMFYVLVGAQMPAVLIEASFITQPDEAEALRAPLYREALAEGIARGIAKYLGQH